MEHLSAKFSGNSTAGTVLTGLALVAPYALFLIVYWPGLTTFFYQDDFGWLNLRNNIERWTDLPRQIFAPYAHGNIRPWSERIPFLVFPAIFGLDPLPFRVLAFVTQFANLYLLGEIVRCITASRLAAISAQVVWTANYSLAIAACWTSVYNQFLSCFFFLLPFYLLLRYIATGERRYFVWQWIAFALGFGALETNVVYPAIAALYTWLFARPYFRKTLPMFAASAVYIALHFWVAPLHEDGVYTPQYDVEILDTLWKYWRMALGATIAAAFRIRNVRLATPLTAMLTAAAFLLLAWSVWRRRWLAVFGLGWFVLTLAPVLPLPDHISDYYLTAPAIGLGLLAAAAVAQAIRGNIAWKAAAVLGIAIYLFASIPAAWAVTQWHWRRSHTVENFVLGVVAAHELNPGKKILITGMTNDLFWAAVADYPFRVFTVPDVYLAPEEEGFIQGSRALIRSFMPKVDSMRADLLKGSMVVFDASGEALKNVTGSYREACCEGKTWGDRR